MYPSFVPLYLLLFLSCLGIRFQVAADDGDTVSAADVWMIKAGTDEGGCSDAYIKLIDTWHDESFDLISNSIQYLENYANDYVVRALTQAFFGVKPATKGKDNQINAASPSTLRKIIVAFENILDFFQGTPLTSVLGKPALFCESTWAVEVQGGVLAVAVDSNGNDMWQNGGPVTIQDAFKTKIKRDQIPFWSPDFKGYQFSTRDEGSAYCTTQDTPKGATSDLLWAENPDKSYVGVTLCPFAFSSNDAIENLPPDGTNLVDYYNVAFHERTSSSDATSLSGVLPRSATLLHEAFHVFYGSSFESVNEVYGVSQCITLNAIDSRRNPENYVLFAVALWYRQYGWDFSRGEAVKVV